MLGCQQGAEATDSQKRVIPVSMQLGKISENTVAGSASKGIQLVESLFVRHEGRGFRCNIFH